MVTTVFLRSSEGLPDEGRQFLPLLELFEELGLDWPHGTHRTGPESTRGGK